MVKVRYCGSVLEGVFGAVLVLDLVCWCSGSAEISFAADLVFTFSCLCLCLVSGSPEEAGSGF